MQCILCRLSSYASGNTSHVDPWNTCCRHL